MKKALFLTAAALLIGQFPLQSHCQLPCGVYHDDLVFDQIDQYIETMYKGITVIKDSKFETVADRNETVRWVLQKDKASDEAAMTITTYFLQQKIKPSEADTEKKVLSAHKLLFLLVKIKQNVDRDIVVEFSKEWDNFKGMFHREGYECEIEKLKQKQIEAKKSAAAVAPQGAAAVAPQEGAKVSDQDDDHDHDHDNENSDHTH